MEEQPCPMVRFADVGPDIPLEAGLDCGAAGDGVAGEGAADDATDSDDDADPFSVAQMRAFLDHADIHAEAELWSAVALGGDDGYADILPGFVADTMTSRVRGGAAQKPKGKGASFQLRCAACSRYEDASRRQAHHRTATIVLSLLHVL